MPVKILALDPGKTTGFCYGALDSDRLIISPGQQEFTLEEMYEFVAPFARQNDNYVVYEDFTYRNYARMGLDLTPVKMIGVIEMIGQQLEKQFYKQLASQAKVRYTDDELKRLGAYKRGLKHGRDAVRHLLYWIEFGAGAQFHTGTFEIALK